MKNRIFIIKMAGVITGLVILVLSTFVYFQKSSKVIYDLKRKYSLKNRNKNCSWSSRNNFISCIKEDIFHITKSNSPYISQSVLEFEIELFKIDQKIQTTDLGKVNSYLEHIHLFLFYLLIRKQTLSNDGLLKNFMARLNRHIVIDEVRLFKTYLLRIKSKYSKVLSANRQIHTRLISLEKELERVLPTLN